MSEKVEIYEFDAIVIGAGIVGLAIAYELSNKYNNILVLDKESSFGQHVSSRNSEVIHSGVYYDVNSLKAQLCVEGNKLMVDFIKKYNINYKNCGKLIVIPTKDKLPKLEALMQNGIDNGLENLHLLTGKDVQKRELLIKSAGALFVPSACIVDSHGIMHKLEFLIKSNGANIVYNMKVVDITYNNDHYILSFNNIDYQVKSKIIINSTGLWCDQIASMLGFKEYKLHICKGDYYKTNLYRNQINSLIYPLPTENSLGIHIVIRLDGTIGFGPNAYYVDEINYNMDDTHKRTFLKHINTFLDLPYEALSADFTGIRPKIQAPGEPQQDFNIINEKERGYNNFINLIGIESPGLTSSFAIAKYVKKIIV